MLRADWEQAAPIDAASEDALIGHVVAALPRVGAVVLSDYAKGALTPRVIRAVIDAANALGKPVVVDPKGRDYGIYRGATLITPNRQELADAMHRAAGDRRGDRGGGGRARPRARRAGGAGHPQRGRHDAGGAGASRCMCRPIRCGCATSPAPAIRWWRCSPACWRSAPISNPPCARPMPRPPWWWASAAPRRSRIAELRSRILPAASLAPEEKIVFDWALLDRASRRNGGGRAIRIGFTNGCFDLLHPGHVRLLAGARAACDRLVVGLNGDASVTRLKGAGRPVQPVEARAEVLAALEAVDLVVVFDQDTPAELIAQVKPTVLVKGADYADKEVVGRDTVEALGGEVILIDLVPGHSTSAMVERARGPQKRCESHDGSRRRSGLLSGGCQPCVSS